MTDAGFPLIEYSAQASPRQRGQAHGENFRAAIGELADIRRSLMIQKNPGLHAARIEQLAAEQWNVTARFDPLLAEELEGIAQGSGLSREALVILNNYTDFRDISVPDQGCSVVYVNRQNPIAAQTWDMHASAKNYVCCIRIDDTDPGGQQVLFSLVGCVGLMGYTARGLAVGVNNINTNGAVPGVLWPVLVRHLLRQRELPAMRRCLESAPVTSGHSYLLADRSQAEFWEVMPDLAERVSQIELPQRGHLFHTNHCLGALAQQREMPADMNSTTRIRYDLLRKKIEAVRTVDEVYQLLNDHENYPKSICSNFQSGAQDPSVTCGGALGDLQTGGVVMWRGDVLYDRNFVRREFDLGTQSRE